MLRHQLYPSSLLQADPVGLCLQMDFLVAATLQLDASLDKAEVRDVFISHGFVMEDLSGDQLRVTGPFLKLKSVKTSLEKLLKSPAKDVTPAPSTVPQVSSRDISRHHTDVVSGAKGRQLASKQSRASPSSSTMSSLPHGSCLEDSPGTPDRPVSVRTGRACFTVKPDLFDYASCLRKKDVDTILVSHDVKLAVKSVDDGYVIILSGKRANVGMDKLKTLLDTLKSLRTQEVPLRDLTPEGRRLVVTFQKSRDIYKSVLVQRRSSSLHLVGPPEEVQVLKERLLGRRPDPSQHRGTRTTGKPSRRASSLPPTSRKTEDGAGARRGQRGALVL